MSDFELFYRDTYIEFSRFLILNAPVLDRVDDLLQEAYYIVFKRFKKADIRDKKAYLFKVGWSLIKKEYKVRQEYPIDLQVTSDKEDTEKKILERITLERLWHYLKTKDIVIQKCVYLYYLGMPNQEIADALHLSLAQVKNYLYRTFKELREVLI